MPELPEVETIVRGLKPHLQGSEIAAIEVLYDSVIQFDSKLLTEVIIGYNLCSVWRRAKVMLWDFESGYTMLFHLKMTGQIIYRGTENFAGGHPTASILEGSDLPDKSTRVIISLADGSKVFFNDQRKFGWIKLLPTEEVHKDRFLRTVGPEFDDINSFTPKYLWTKTRNRITPIKAILLDQSVVAGIGNIYADEALHLAKIHPARKASSLSKAEVAALFNAVVEVLNAGIAHGGTSFKNFVDSNGRVGDHVNHLRVFRREGQTCPVCGNEILKARVAGRGTHYCPTCQRIPSGWKQT